MGVVRNCLTIKFDALEKMPKKSFELLFSQTSQTVIVMIAVAYIKEFINRI